MIVEYRVLGPLEVLLDGEPVPVPAGRGRVLLATLLLRANEIVPVNELVDRVWDGRPPAADRAHKTLQTVVLRLRQSLGAANCVRTSPRGYSAEIGPGQLDLAEFRRLVALGEHRAALELWRGPALGDVASESLHREDVPKLVEEHLAALEQRIDEDLAGATDVLVPELRALTEQHPLHETFWAQLMLALHRAGQQAEALAAYQEIRGRLAGELGADPGRRLLEAHDQVLRGETPSRVVPRQLPPPHPHFVGREDELARLTDAVRARPGEPVLISAINGIGGVGKTALALQWANQVAHRFPDGQLHVDLRGFDTLADPLDPFGVARDFLLALGVPSQDVPSADDEVIAAYRSVLGRRRVLVVLDNARDANQVRPLLPGGAGNVVLITSRNRLNGLVARQGAQPVALDVMDEDAAVRLLEERVGPEKVAAEPDAVARLVQRCAGLPLALGIVAARAAYGDPLTLLADELKQERLDALDVDDVATSVRPVFSWSLRSVSEQAERTFVLLGLHPGPDFAVEAAASLAGVPPAQARRVLDELVASSLVTLTKTSRFVLHDLLRDYAAECAGVLPDAQRAEASQRMFDHYLHTSLEANQRREKTVPWTPLAPPSPLAVIVPIPDVKAAFAWEDGEHRVLQAVLRAMVAAGADDRVWRLGYTMHMHLLSRGRLAEAEDVELMALAAAQRRDDVFGQARLHRSLSGVYIAKKMYGEAESQLTSALRCETELGNANGRSNVSRGLAFVYEMQGRLADALDVLGRAHGALGSMSRWERCCHLAALGRVQYLIGDPEVGLELCLRADEEFVEASRGVPAFVMSMNCQTLGRIHLESGRFAEALDAYREAIRVMRVIRETHNLPDGLVLLAKAHIAAGEPEQAREALAEALALYEEQGRAEAAEVRDLFASLTNV